MKTEKEVQTEFSRLNDLALERLGYNVKELESMTEHELRELCQEAKSKERAMKLEALCENSEIPELHLALQEALDGGYKMGRDSGFQEALLWVLGMVEEES